MPAPDPQKYNLSINDVCSAYGVSRWTLWRWIKDGEFPKPVKVGKKKRWCADDLSGVPSK